MPTPDASQFTTLKRYNAVDFRGDNAVKVLTHLYQPVPTVRNHTDFLPSFTNKIASPFLVRLPNHPSGPQTKPRVPAANPVVSGQH